MKKLLLDVSTPSCHASTVVRTGNHVLVAWFGGTAEKSPDVGIYAARGADGVYRADSADGGRTWSKAYRTALANNNSGVGLARASDGTLFLACNPVGANWDERTPLTLLRSRDNGASWERVYTLEDAPEEYSYPAVVAEEDVLLITYTWNRQKIAFCELPIKQTERKQSCNP